LCQLLVKLVWLTTPKCRFVKGGVGGSKELDGLPRATNFKFSPPSSPFTKKTILFILVRSNAVGDLKAIAATPVVPGTYLTIIHTSQLPSAVIVSIVAVKEPVAASPALSIDL